MIDRDTHFLTSATIVARLIGDTRPDDLPTLLAQYAYDIARNAIDETAAGYYASHYLAEGEDMADVSSLTEWSPETAFDRRGGVDY